MSPPDLVVTGGRIVSPETSVYGDLVVEDGRIVAVLPAGTAPPGRETIDAEGLYVLPGAIDVHVHFREPGFAWKETWTTGTRAAAMGGVTTVFEMPNTDPATATPEAVAQKLAIAGGQACVDFGVYGLMSESSLPLMRDMVAAGAVAFKLFMGSDNPRTPVPSDGAILDALSVTRELGLRTTVHAESSAILKWQEAKLKAAGRSDFAAHLEQHLDIAAAEAVSRIALFSEWTGAAVHIAHENSRFCLPVIAAAKARGVDLTAETCPHYLTLSTEDTARLGGSFLRVKPPVREPGHAEPLFEALRDGVIDILSTDHAPHLPEEKARASMWDCAPGFPGVETSMVLMLREVSAGRLDLRDYVRMACAAPAKAFGLTRKGRLEEGADADIVLVDMDRRGHIRASSLQSLGNATPFDGFALHGMPVRTILRGRTIMLDGQPLPAPGWGRNVART